MQHRRARWFGAKTPASLILLFAAACGAASQKPVTVTPLTPDEERAFEHGVDYIAKLDGLEGKWREDWDRDLAQRVASADAIVVVSLRTLRTDIDPEQRVTHRMFAQVERTISGDAGGKEVELAVREETPGFTSVHQNWNTLESKQFIAYLKWFRTDVGSLAAHFHLSPASDEVLRETEAMLAAKKPAEPQGRVIVHHN